MSTALETLEICFAANLNGVDAQLEGLAARLGALSDAAEGADGALAATGRNMVGELNQGFSAALPKLKARIAALGGELKGWMDAAASASGAERTGRALAARFASGVSGGAGDASSMARAVAAAARFTGGTSAAESAGRQLANGFAAGIRSGTGAVGSAVSSLVNSALKRIRSMLAIHSPSKVAGELGGYFGEGFALGMGGSVAAVERASDALAAAASAGVSAPEISELAGTSDDGLARAVRSAVERALGGTEITIPLHVDGMKLGEASIRGINAVTRGVGRVLLEI